MPACPGSRAKLCQADAPFWASALGRRIPSPCQEPFEPTTLVDNSHQIRRLSECNGVGSTPARTSLGKPQRPVVSQSGPGSVHPARHRVSADHFNECWSSRSRSTSHLSARAVARQPSSRASFRHNCGARTEPQDLRHGIYLPLFAGARWLAVAAQLRGDS
jgi:hypothetical protein